jgi:hypothetical protein
MGESLGLLHDQRRIDRNEGIEVAMRLDAPEKQFSDLHRRERVIPDLVGDLRCAGGHQFAGSCRRHISASLEPFGQICSGCREHGHCGDRGFEHLFDVGEAEGKALLPIGEALGMGITTKRRYRAQ